VEIFSKFRTCPLVAYSEAFLNSKCVVADSQPVQRGWTPPISHGTLLILDSRLLHVGEVKFSISLDVVM
jgi:hypothetical protein